MSRLSSRHLLGLEGVPKQDIQLILDTAESFREVLDRTIKKLPTLRGITVLNLFYEPSTRTRISFELAQKRLSADSVNFTAATSSVKKGESLRDTVQNIEAMKIDMVVVRHQSAGVPYYLTQCMEANIINAGDGAHEHPTQGLLDMFTIRRKYKKLDGLRVVLVGDVKHSRVTRSNIWGLKTMGASVALCGPSTLIPADAERFGCDIYTNLDEALDGADVVNIMRIQLERQQSGSVPVAARIHQSVRDYERPAGAVEQELHHHASRADESGRGNHQRGRRQRQIGHSGAGYQRSGSAYGGAVSSVGAQRGRGRVMATQNYDLVIKNGRVIDPALGFSSDACVLIRDGKIAGIETESAALEKALARVPDDCIIDAKGKLVTPGLIDCHVHLREPGRESAETVESGCRAAAAGGFTSVLCMPNTHPRIDNQETVKFVQDRAKNADARVFVVGAMTKNIEGKELSEIGDLVGVGVVSITDDGFYVQNPEIMRRALEYSRMFNIPVMQHAEDQFLVGSGVMNESFESSKLGVKGSPAVAEEIAVLRDIALCRITGARLHIQHITTRRAIEAVRQAKREGISVTTEACPHHFVLTDEEIGKAFDTSLKVNPPLRTREDVDAVIEGLVDGTIDCIASDHAPHTDESKDCEFDQAPSGMIGLETTLGLVKTYLIDKGILDWGDAIRKMTVNPARIFNLPGGSLTEGSPADITIIDPDRKWTVRADRFQSKSKNSPFIGWKLSGLVYRTILNGRVVYEAK